MVRSTLTSEVLHRIEDHTYEPQLRGDDGHAGITIAGLVVEIEKSETTIRKAVNELERDGFIRKDGADGRSWRYVAVRKNEDGEEVKDMAEKTEKKSGAGRPRSTDVIDRDAKALEFIGTQADGATVEEVAKALGVERNSAYLSVWRLKKTGQVAKNTGGSRSPRWTKVA